MSTHHNVPEAHGQHDQVPGIPNKAANNVPFYTPLQDPPAGTASDPQPDGGAIPKLFQPLKIRSLTLQNRIMLSPLCQYSAQDGHFTSWHMAHLGGIISRGPGLAMIEATSVTPEGRITPEDSGLWKDSQTEALRPVVEFAHSQNQHIGIQIAHAGRKASTVAPWLSSAATATKDVNGWPDNVVAPSAIRHSDALPMPRALTLAEIDDLKMAYTAAFKRALAAGFDVIEIHNAHGYLLHEFLSPASNQRTDQYGGSFENRVRLTLEVVELARAVMPAGMPLFLRISATDWLEEAPAAAYGGESWTSRDTVRLAGLLAARGVDLLDVSSGGNHRAQRITTGPGYQAPFAKDVKRELGAKLLVGTVGTITGAKQANQLLDEGGLDLAIVGRMFQKDPGLVWSWAEELGVQINVANQIRWGFGGRPGAPKR